MEDGGDRCVMKGTSVGMRDGGVQDGGDGHGTEEADAAQRWLLWDRGDGCIMQGTGLG